MPCVSYEPVERRRAGSDGPSTDPVNWRSVRTCAWRLRRVNGYNFEDSSPYPSVVQVATRFTTIHIQELACKPVTPLGPKSHQRHPERG